MLEISVCFEPLFSGKIDLEKIQTIHNLGYNAVEFWDLAGKDLKGIAKYCQKTGVKIGICTLKDPWGNIRLHADTNSYVKHFSESLELLQLVGSKKVIVLTGENDGKSAQTQVNQIVKNLQAISSLAEKAGIVVCLEVLNSKVDHKGYFLDSSALGFEIIRQVNSPSIKVLYDIYHMQIMEGNIISTIQENINLIGHFHSAGVPGRHEHFYGELDYRNIFLAIQEAGYDGFFGLEYWPTMPDEKSLEKVREYFLDV